MVTQKLMTPMLEKMLEFSNLGQAQTKNGTMLYGKAPHVGELAYLHTLYLPLSDDEILLLGEMTQQKIPSHLAQLYKECNGFHYFMDTLAVDGLRPLLGRNMDVFYQPYDLTTINLDERIRDASPDMVFFGGYGWDNSLVYTTTNDQRVFYCSPTSSKPLKIWNSIADFLDQESKRIGLLFDTKGVALDKEQLKIPV